MLIVSDIELDDLSKLIHLRSSLSPVPLSTIDCLELTGCNYGKALRLLQHRYENKSIIVQAHINELFNLKRLRQTDSEALRIMVDTVNSQLVALKSISNEQEILDAIIFHLIRSKLDDETISGMVISGISGMVIVSISGMVNGIALRCLHGQCPSF